MIVGKKLVDDAIEVLEGDHVDYTTLSEKFGHSKEIMTKSATNEGRILTSVASTPHILL